MENKHPDFFTLNNGSKIPSIGLGSAHMDDAVNVVYNSIKAGARLIDTSDNYNNETELGQGIKKAIEDGIVKREELFIVTKLDNRENVIESCKKSLERLQLTYIDLYLDHWPNCINFDEKNNIIRKAPIHVVWAEMEKLVKMGLTKSIGVSNYNNQSLCNLLSFCEIKPVVNEVEFHPYLYQKGLYDLCKRANVHILAYNPLVRGHYCAEYFKEQHKDLLSEKIIVELSKKYNKTPGQIVLNWFVSLGMTPIPRTSKVKRFEENIGAKDFKLSEEDVKSIGKLDDEYHFRYCESTNWPKTFSGIDLFA